MTLDLTPFRAFTVGFDSLFDELDSFKTVSYPPYNIEKIKDGAYNISMAIAGFSKDDLTISVKEKFSANLLTSDELYSLNIQFFPLTEKRFIF